MPAKDNTTPPADENAPTVDATTAPSRAVTTPYSDSTAAVTKETDSAAPADAAPVEEKAAKAPRYPCPRCARPLTEEPGGTGLCGACGGLRYSLAHL